MELKFNGVYSVVLRKLAKLDDSIDEKEIDELYVLEALLDLIDGEVYETLSAEVYDTLMEYGNNDSISEEEAFKLFDEVDNEYISPTTIYASSKGIEPNTARYKDLKGSIAKAGGNRIPILVNVEGDKLRIKDGHKRYLACKSLGLPVKYMILDTTEEEQL